MPTLDWIGKKAVVNHHNEVPFHLLKVNNTLSIGDSDSENLLVQGDNLLALKALLPKYSGSVKCIYIDPPYNTGNENWVYNDNVNSPGIREWLGKTVGKEAEDLSRHDKWLCMMYPRLQLLKKFLRKDGVIMVSIDDFEVFNLRCLMNEIFGANNFVAQLVWDKTRKNDAKLFSVGHEYLVVYARSLSTLRKLNTVWREPKPGADEIMAQYRALKLQHGEDYEAIESDLREWYRGLPKTHPSKKLSRYRHVDKWGVWRDRDISWPGSGGPTYDVIHPFTGLPCKVPEAGWRFASPKEMQRQIDLGLVVFRDDHTNPPFRKAHLIPIPEELDGPSNSDSEGDADDEEAGLQVMPSVIQKQAQVAVKLLRNIFGGRKVFENPKDHEVLMRLIKYVTAPGDIILDAFAGSGSTGHAVLQLNNGSKGRRRFILIEMDENICRNVTTERLRRVIEGYSYPAGSGSKRVEGLGGGFTYNEIDAPLLDSEGQLRDDLSYEALANFVFFLEIGQPPPAPVNGERPLVGVANGVAVYLLYKALLKEKLAQNGEVLTNSTLASLPVHKGPKVIYATGCRVSPERLAREGITFRQIPYHLRVG